MRSNENLFTCRAGDCTAALQEAMNESAASGVRLVLGDGVHHCGGLVLPSGLHLHVSEGAVLKPAGGYEVYAGNVSGVVAENSDRVILLARGAKNIRITGGGVIDAPGADYIVGRLDDMGTHVPAERRPRVMVFENCSDLVLAGFCVRNSPMWTIHLIDCRNVHVEGVRVDNDREMPNTDGIVIDACENVTIAGVDIATADDGIVLKTSLRKTGEPVGACRNISVTGSRIESRSCALKIGTETHGAIEDVTFSDCAVVRSNRGLGIFSRDGGRIANVAFRRISVDCHETPDGFWGSGEAITVNVVDRRPGRPAGPVVNVLFEEITGRMEGAINLVADSLSGIRNLTLRRVALEQADGAFSGRCYDVRPTTFDLAPSPDAAGRANAWVKDAEGKVVGLVPYPGGMPGLYALNVEGLVIEDLKIERPAPAPEGWNVHETVVTSGIAPVWSR